MALVGAWPPPGLIENEDHLHFDYNIFAVRCQLPTPTPDDIIASMSDSLILASGSPRRQALLASLGLSFSVDTADVDETPLAGEAPAAMVCRLCRAKARSVAERRPGATILAADTVVALQGRLLGKPADAAEATAMLLALRDQTHQVYTAVCVSTNGELRSGLSVSHVTMRRYDEAELGAYVDSGDPLDKAGAYAIQHPHFSPVARWEGCYPSIMGLPFKLTAELLTGAGIAVRTDVAALCERLSGAGCCTRGDQSPTSRYC
jgi:septum formation protein